MDREPFLMYDYGHQLKTIQEFRVFLRKHGKEIREKKDLTEGRIGIYLSQKELNRLLKFLEEPEN